jgi:ABC-type multidrug transport system ATPase subunit
MKISLTKAGKRYNRDWIFRNLSYEFVSGTSYAITGPNGSGKSTLLQAIGGALVLSEGSVEYEAESYALHAARYTQGSRNSGTINHKLQTTNSSSEALPKEGHKLSSDNIYRHLSIAAPYLELIEEMTVKEFLLFHAQFKPFLSSISINNIIATVGLEKAIDKQLRYYSSGMKQRVKLAQAIFSDVAIVLLDEPCTNLDAEGISLYQQLIADHCKNRLVIVSSNDEAEYGFCQERLSIMQYKIG